MTRSSASRTAVSAPEELNRSEEEVISSTFKSRPRPEPLSLFSVLTSQAVDAGEAAWQRKKSSTRTSSITAEITYYVTYSVYTHARRVCRPHDMHEHVYSVPQPCTCKVSVMHREISPAWSSSLGGGGGSLEGGYQRRGKGSIIVDREQGTFAQNHDADKCIYMLQEPGHLWQADLIVLLVACRWSHLLSV